MSSGYQPLAAYGALADIPVEEAHFRSGVDHDDMIHAGRFGASYVRPAPGFQSLIYLHDGQRHRALAFWQDREAIEQFHREQREELLERERAELPDSPWITHLKAFRSGIARRQLMGPRMSLEQTDLATPSPPATVTVCDFAGVTDTNPLLDAIQHLASTSGPPRIQQYRGFMFFSVCDFGNGDATLYLSFRTSEDHANFRSSDSAIDMQERLRALADAQQATLSTSDGQLLGWTVRQFT